MSRFVTQGLRALVVLALALVSTQALAVDYADFGRADNVVKKTFKLTGDFGTCGGSGTPDTEVRTFKQNDLGGGVVQEIQTRRRYAGGSSGALCVTFVAVFIKTATENMLVQNIRYDQLGNVVWNIKTGYDSVDCPHCGIVLANSSMLDGIDWASASDWYEKIGATRGMVISKGVLLRSGFAETINEGRASEETFLNCMEVWEDRRSNSVFGNRSVLRRACEDVGTVFIAQVDDRGGLPNEKLWELVYYKVEVP